jgi:hypothetical protein
MTPIQHDPARRIRRIQRLGDRPLEEYLEFTAPTPGEFERAELPSQFKIRFRRGNRLAKRARLTSEERTWLCSYAETLPTNIPGMSALVDRYTLEYKARESELVDARQTIAEQKARIAALESAMVSAMGKERVDAICILRSALR